MGDMIKVLFFARKSKSNSTGDVPVYFRVTVNGQRFERQQAVRLNLPIGLKQEVWLLVIQATQIYLCHITLTYVRLSGCTISTIGSKIYHRQCVGYLS